MMCISSKLLQWKISSPKSLTFIYSHRDTQSRLRYHSTSTDNGVWRKSMLWHWKVEPSWFCRLVFSYMKMEMSGPHDIMTNSTSYTVSSLINLYYETHHCLQAVVKRGIIPQVVCSFFVSSEAIAGDHHRSILEFESQKLKWYNYKFDLNLHCPSIVPKIQVCQSNVFNNTTFLVSQSVYIQ